MPEGDTLFRTAATLHRVLAGKRVARCESQLVTIERADLVGQLVVRVEARGKNVLIHFEDGRVLHTHMRMHGSWHVYPIGERWRGKRSEARVVLTVEDVVAVCFSAPVVRLLVAGALPRDREVATLGPDLLDPACDLVQARVNLRTVPSLEIGQAIMRQSLVAGVGNIFKSESLFAVRTNPFRLVSDLDDDALDRLLGQARTFLKANTMHGGARSTRASLSGSKTWVYMRAREPCFVCRTPLEMRRQGPPGGPPRSTYFCSKCQC